LICSEYFFAPVQITTFVPIGGTDQYKCPLTGPRRRHLSPTRYKCLTFVRGLTTPRKKNPHIPLFSTPPSPTSHSLPYFLSFSSSSSHIYVISKGARKRRGIAGQQSSRPPARGGCGRRHAGLAAADAGQGGPTTRGGAPGSAGRRRPGSHSSMSNLFVSSFLLLNSLLCENL
jgi:hypothetical protein